MLVTADAAAIFVRRRDDAGDLARAGALVRQDVVALRRVARVPLAQQPLRAVVDGVARQVPARVVYRVDVAHNAHFAAAGQCLLNVYLRSTGWSNWILLRKFK